MRISIRILGLFSLCCLSLTGPASTAAQEEFKFDPKTAIRPCNHYIANQNVLNALQLWQGMQTCEAEKELVEQAFFMHTAQIRLRSDFSIAVQEFSIRLMFLEIARQQAPLSVYRDKATLAELQRKIEHWTPSYDEYYKPGGGVPKLPPETYRAVISMNKKSMLKRIEGRSRLAEDDQYYDLWSKREALDWKGQPLREHVASIERTEHLPDTIDRNYGGIPIELLQAYVDQRAQLNARRRVIFDIDEVKPTLRLDRSAEIVVPNDCIPEPDPRKPEYVIVSTDITRGGRVRNAKIVETTDECINEPVMRVLSKTRYKPPTLNGERITVKDFLWKITVYEGRVFD